MIYWAIYWFGYAICKCMGCQIILLIFRNSTLISSNSLVHFFTLHLHYSHKSCHSLHQNSSFNTIVNAAGVSYSSRLILHLPTLLLGWGIGNNIQDSVSVRDMTYDIETCMYGWRLKSPVFSTFIQTRFISTPYCGWFSMISVILSFVHYDLVYQWNG